MIDEFNYVVNVFMPKEIAQILQDHEIEGVEIDSMTDAKDEQFSQFGLVEGVTLVVLITGVLQIVKMALEIHKQLRSRHQKKQVAFLSTPDGTVRLQITSDMDAKIVAALIEESFT